MDGECECSSCAYLNRAAIDPNLRKEILEALNDEDIDRAYELLHGGEE